MAKKEEKGLAKRGTTAITKWDEELAKWATETAEKEQMPSGSFVSLKAGVLSIGGSPIKDNKVQVIIIDHVYENTHYDGDYDPDNPSPPSCYAFGREESDLKPHEKASEPVHEQCDGCPNNVFGSAEKGKGKACKNTRRLALISADGLSPTSVADGELVFMKLPVTSTKGWAYYVKGLSATLRRPPFAVVTEISVVPDAKSQFKVTFNAVGNVPDNVVGAVMKRREKVQEEIMFPYGTAEKREEQPKAKGRGKGKEQSKARRF
jgi:hypothetical protein